MPSDVMTLREVADYLKMHRMTIYKLVRSRQLPMAKIGGQWRIRHDQLQQWLNDKLEDSHVSR